MRPTTALRLLVPFLAALATACDDAPSPVEPLSPTFPGLIAKRDS